MLKALSYAESVNKRSNLELFMTSTIKDRILGLLEFFLFLIKIKKLFFYY